MVKSPRYPQPLVPYSENVIDIKLHRRVSIALCKGKDAKIRSILKNWMKISFQPEQQQPYLPSDIQKLIA